MNFKKIQVIVFDLDDTLIQGDSVDRVLPDTKRVLDRLKGYGYRLCVASHNACAEWYLEKNKLSDYFECVQAFVTPDCSKIEHMTNIMRALNIKKNECILFDDHLDIVADLMQHGIPAFHVNDAFGVTLENVSFLVPRIKQVKRSSDKV